MTDYKDSAEYKAYQSAFGSEDAKQEPIPTSFDQAMEQTGLSNSDSFGMPLLPAPPASTPPADNPPTVSTKGFNYKNLLVPAIGLLALYLLFKKK